MEIWYGQLFANCEWYKNESIFDVKLLSVILKSKIPFIEINSEKLNKNSVELYVSFWG